MDHNEIWQKAQPDLSRAMGKPTYDLHLATAELQSIEGNTWTIAIPGELSIDALQNQLITTITNALAGHSGHPVSVEFVVRNEEPEEEEPEESIFLGFPLPEQNYSKLPHELIHRLPRIDTLGEMKVLIYLLRHTWGFQEYGIAKRITIDEFRNGRKYTDGVRMDKGVGMGKPAIIKGIRRAVAHGFILVEKDGSDKGRVKHYYKLNMFSGNERLSQR